VNKRANLFEEIDISSFTPKAVPNGPSKDEVKAISDQAMFPSRQPAQPAAPVPARVGKRPPRVHRTGRNIQLSVKVSQEAIDAFYRISDERRWILGETFERAMIALEEQLKASS
jgi:hypothetical protein